MKILSRLSRSPMLAIPLGLVAVLAIVMLPSTPPAAAADASDNPSVQIAALLNEMRGLDGQALQRLASVQIPRLTLPDASVDVMRVQLAETYSIDGVGTDTVQLTGWIAVRHGAARAKNLIEPVSWKNSLVDTEFVGLDLRGNSDIFGPVHVTLDGSRPAVGQVGNIEVPEIAVRALRAANEAADSQDKDHQAAIVGESAAARPPVKRAEVTKGLTPEHSRQELNDTPEGDAELEGVLLLACRAPVAVAVAMPDLKLEMTTKSHATWYSLVDTIPPVGHRASVTVDPIRLVSEGREVGTLTSGVVNFREVVRRVNLDTPAIDQYAALPGSN